MKKHFTFLLLLFFIGYNVNSYCQRLEKRKVYVANKDDDTYFLQEKDSFYYVVVISESDSGYFNSHTPGRTLFNYPYVKNYWLMKLNKQLNIIWKRNMSVDMPNDVFSQLDDTYFPFEDNYPKIKIKQSGIYCTSYTVDTFPISNARYEGRVTKYDFNGNLIWSRNKIDTSGGITNVDSTGHGYLERYAPLSNTVVSDNDYTCKYTIGGDNRFTLPEGYEDQRYLTLNMIGTNGQLLWRTRIYDSIINTNSFNTTYNSLLPAPNLVSIVDYRVAFVPGTNDVFAVLSGYYYSASNNHRSEISVILKINGTTGQIESKRYVDGYSTANAIALNQNELFLLSHSTDTTFKQMLSAIKYNYASGTFNAIELSSFRPADTLYYPDDQIGSFTVNILSDNSSQFFLPTSDTSLKLLTIDNSGSILHNSDIPFFGSIPGYVIGGIDKYSLIFSDNSILTSDYSFSSYVYNLSGTILSSFVFDTTFTHNGVDYTFTGVEYSILNDSLYSANALYSSDTDFFQVIYIINKYTGALSYRLQFKLSNEEYDYWNKIFLTNNSFYTIGSNHIITKNNSDLVLAKYSLLDNIIAGKIFIDNDSNNIYNIGLDILFSSGKVNSFKQNESFINYITSDGQFQNSVDTGIYTTSFLPGNNYFSISPVSRITSHSTYGNSDTVDFALHPKAAINDLSVSMSNTWVTVPSLPNTYEVVYNNDGTTVVNNAIVSVVLDGRLLYSSAVPSPTFIAGDTLKWNIATLNPSQQGNIRINFSGNTPPFLNGEDSLLSYANIRPVSADSTPINNDFILTDIAHYSFDPNDKNIESNSELTASQITSGDYITYRVRFQNTGSYYATNVIILDTLENNLDWNSLQIVSASHPGLQTSVRNNNVIEFRFNNINLPAASENEALSHGYVVFKIKPKNSLLAGASIKNTAHITFDFNIPVKTNTAIAKVIIVTPTKSNTSVPADINIYPNPSNGNFIIVFTLNGKMPLDLKMFDVAGNEILSQTLQHYGQTSVRVNIETLAAGSYTITVGVGTHVWSRKILVVK